MQLNETFDRVAELYDRARPRYPEELYDDLARLTGIQPGSRVLEIAPATGIVTVPLARRGYNVTAVELGQNLAAVARRNLEPYPNARVEVSRFEEWPLPASPFDLICCATAFSWLDPSVRLTKCAQALRPGGHLAIWDTHHVAGGTAQFFIEVQECYEHWDPDTESGLRLVAARDITPKTYGIEEHGEFDSLEIRDYVVTLPYSTASYLDVLRTYSPMIALDEPLRRGLLSCIERLIDSSYGGRIEKEYLFQLVLARRK
ncbi:MAG: class I SAM-dependent methyltransferase [Dehalococcoidia bacterium]